MTTKTNIKEYVTDENFAELFEEAIRSEKIEGTVVKGTVVAIKNADVYVDVGLKSEGRIPLKEFQTVENPNPDIKIGDTVEVFIDKAEDRYGSTSLSRTMALREEAWQSYENIHARNENVEGVIIGRVKGGFAVELNGIVAFLPGSQVDIRPIKDVTALMNIKQPFKILKMDNDQGNVVVSRRAILEENRAEARDALLASINEGTVLEGTVKNITDYGAFIDLGSIDGLLHITDISWRKITHPSELLSMGQVVKVMVIKYNEETKRVSLGMKQLEKNPWEGFESKFQSGQRLTGTVTTVADYGAFVEVEPGIEGLVYQTEISWNAKNAHPKKFLKMGDKVEVVVLELDVEKHKLGLSMKQCRENPWKQFAQNHPVGSKIEGVVQTVAEFGIFVLLEGDNADLAVEGLVPAVELSWDTKPEIELKKYNKGDAVKTVVLSVDTEKERISLGVRQLTDNKFASQLSSFKKNDVVTCTVTEIGKDGISVEVSEGVTCYIKKNELSRHKSEQRPERFGLGDKVDAKIISIDTNSNKLSLSIKAHEIEEEKRTIAEYGSADSGASLGDILGVALSKAAAAPAKEAKKPATVKASAKKKS